MRVVKAKPVMSGSQIKWTLEQIEQKNPGRVRLDWLRFTIPLDAVIKSERALFDVTELDLLDHKGLDLVRSASTVNADPYTTAHKVSAAGARLVAQMIHPITVGTVDERGMDFYTAKTALVYEGVTVGFVLAGGQKIDQARTVHVNLFGEAMLHVTPESLAKLREFIGANCGWITRSDLSLDVWSGHQITDVPELYKAGQFDMRGKRPGQTDAGSWHSGHSRTFYVGSRGTGKLFRAYEKGHQLFGPESGSPWIRYEVELRNNNRIIDLDVLIRPADFFAGTYPFCQNVLAELDVSAQACVIPTQLQIKDATDQAAVQRTVNHTVRSAAPAIVAIFEYGADLLADIIENERHRLPKRLNGISKVSLRAAFEKVATAFAPAVSPLSLGAC